MTVIHDIHLNLDKSNVLRREGITGESQVKPEILKLIEELLFTIKDKHTLEPAIICEIYPVAEINENKLSLGKITLHGSIINSSLTNAKEVAVLLCTIGPKLEDMTEEYVRNGEKLRGMLLDGIGSAAVDSLAQEACKHIADVASSQGQQTSSPLGPGMPGFPITEQKQLFRLVSSGKIGVTLSPSGVMVPQKSVSMVVGIGEGMVIRTQVEVCARCNLSKTCRYRVGK